MSATAPSTLFSRITRLAGDRRIHTAFRWFHLNDGKLMDWQRTMVAIPAPPFGEMDRALWFADRLQKLELADIYIDNEGNAGGVYASGQAKPNGQYWPAADQPAQLETILSSRPVILISAHLDTVFPAGTPLEPILEARRLTAPGACDNAAGVIGLLAIAAALKAAQIELACDVVFVGNVGEEGEGDLRGIRHVYEQSVWSSRIAAHIVLDGAGDQIAVNEAVGSRRFLVSIAGPGGHSWSDADAPNPIVLLAEAISDLSSLQLPALPRTTLNVGTIEGGSAVNAVPERASARLDLRSTDANELLRLEVEMRRAVEDSVRRANNRPYPHGPRPAALTFSIEQIGDRPAGKLPPDSAILETLRAVDRHLGLQTQLRLASTDANIPLSLGIPALSLGAGGEGGGIHTRNEWFDATGRELALKRILLLLLALAENVEQSRHL
jgi:acetylornithine deacetylase/succinyl-diaminopimelate desuccinylase-like protein